MSRPATARLFVAIDPPGEVRRRLAQWAREAAGGANAGSPRRARRPRVLPADSLHLTLCFLGNRPFAEIPALGAALGACATAVGELSVGAPLWLPPRRPRALAVEVHDRDGELGHLQAALVRELTQASGWEPQRRRFRAHITLARLHDGGPRGGAERQPLPATPQLRFTPQAIMLYRSYLEPDGAVYEALASSDLAERA